MNKISKLLVALASITLITGCRKLSGGTNDKPTEDQVMDAYKKMESLTNFTTVSSISIVGDREAYSPIPFVEETVKIPLVQTYIIKNTTEKMEKAEKSSSDMTKTRYELDLEAVRLHLNLNYETNLTLDEVTAKAKSFTPKKGETYVVNETNHTVTYEMISGGTTESYEIYDEEAKQSYSVRKSGKKYYFSDYIYDRDSDGVDSLLLGTSSIEEIFEKGTRDTKTGVFSYDTVSNGDKIHAELRFSIANGYLSKISVVATSNGKAALSLESEYKNIGTTSFEVPDVKPVCRYDHNIGHTPSRFIETKEGHRLACQDCYRYLDDKFEAHDHSHNENNICEKCGYVIGKSSEYAVLDDEVINKLVKLYPIEGKDILVFSSCEYPYDKYYDDSADDNSIEYFLYESEKVLVIDTSTPSAKVYENSCIEYQNHNLKVYENLTDEEIAAIKLSLESTKALLEGLTPAKTIDSFRVNGESHVNKDLEDCESLVINECRTETYIKCSNCDKVLHVNYDIHHDDEHLNEVSTKINDCVTKVDTICSRCNEVVYTNYNEDHDHQEEVFFTFSELANHNFDLEGFEPYYENSLFYFVYCETCGQVGRTYDNGGVTVYEINLDVVQSLKHNSGCICYCKQAIREDGVSNYTFAEYGYESSYFSIPHHLDEHGECVFCHAKHYELDDELANLYVRKDKNGSYEWTFTYKYSDTATFYSDTEGYPVGEIVDHVKTYSVYAHSTYLLIAHYDDNDEKIIKLEVYKSDGTTLICTVQ